MTPDRFNEVLQLWGWSLRGLADYLGVNYSTVLRWSNGRNPIPRNVAAWLETVAAPFEAHPYPDGWTPPP